MRVPSFTRLAAAAAAAMLTVTATVSVGATSTTGATPRSSFQQFFDLAEQNYHVSDVAAIEAYGEAALRQRGPRRLYALWSVLYVYKDHMVFDRLRSLIKQVRAMATAEHDQPLADFADLFEVSIQRDEDQSVRADFEVWSRFLERSGPDVRLMAIVEVISHCADMRQWARGSELALAGLGESRARGPDATPVAAEMHQQYAELLSAMGSTAGAIEQVRQAIRLDQAVRLRTQDLARIYHLADMAAQAGDLDAADKLARIHYRLAQTSRGPNPRFWTRFLCARVADAQQQWRRVLACSQGLAADLTQPKSASMAGLLAYRGIARAHVGDVAGARGDLAVLTGMRDRTIKVDPDVVAQLRIFVDEAQGHRARAFEALDRLRRSASRAAEIAHRTAVGEISAALENELQRERSESEKLAEALDAGRGLTIAWRLIAGLLGVLIVGGLGLVWHLRRVSDALRVVGRDAEAASAAKSTFLAVMSHELRTPLNGMLGMAQVLAATELTPQQRDQLDTLSEAGAALLAILNDVLDLSKIQAGGLEIVLEAADIRTTCESVVAVYAFAAAERHTRLELHVDGVTPPSLMFDTLRVRQCLANLLSNAVKFTSEGAIIVRLAVEPQTVGFRVRITIADGGIGMSPDTCARLFGPFVQADASTTRRYGGTGLGLNITRRLANMMGGDVAVTSEEGVGSVFTLTFEAAAAREPAFADADATKRRPTYAAASMRRTKPDFQARERAGEDAEAAPPGARRVLVVDDHPVNRKVASLMLRQFGCDVVEADNGVVALERLAVGAFDLVLMDVNMPVMDGFEATRRIRAHPPWAGVPIVALTADAGGEDVEACLAAGMDAHLAKPIMAATLAEVVRQLTGPQRAPDPRRMAVG